MKEGILDLIKKHKNLYVFSSPEGRALFSLLPIKDYYLIKRVAVEFPGLRLKIEEDIWRDCVIEQTFGGNPDNLPAGIVTTIAQVIMQKSCPTNIDKVGEDLDKARGKMGEMVRQLVLKVCEAFPNYSPEDVFNFDWETLIERVAESEKILGAELEFNGKRLGAAQLGSGSTMATKIKDGVEVFDFDAMNREMAKG